MIQQILGSFGWLIPSNWEQLLWMLMGLQFAYAFGKRCDAEIQASPWFAGLNRFQKYLVESCLNFMHHWYVILLAFYLPSSWVPIRWFLIGIFWDDVRDIQNMVRRYRKMAKILSDLAIERENNHSETPTDPSTENNPE